MPNSSNFLIILGRPWLRDINAVHNRSRNPIRIHLQGKTIIIIVDSCVTSAKAALIRHKAETDWVKGLSQDQETLVLHANLDLNPLA